MNVPPFGKPMTLVPFRDYRAKVFPCSWPGCRYVTQTSDPNEMDAHVRGIHMRDNRGNYHQARRAVDRIRQLGYTYEDIANGRVDARQVDQGAKRVDLSHKFGRRIA